MADANYPIPESPVYNPNIRALKDSDPAQASSIFNPLFQQLIENTAAVKQQADATDEKVEKSAEQGAAGIKMADGSTLEEAVGGLQEGKADLDPVTHKVLEEQLPDMNYEKTGTAAAAVEAHDADIASHQDIREAVAGAVSAAGTASRNAAAAVEAAGQAQETADAALDAITKLAHTIDAVPSQNGSLTYTGGAQSSSWNSYNPDTLILGGVTTGTNAGTYTAVFTPKEGYTWGDGTADPKSVVWTIGRASIATVPTQSGTLTYTGNAQSPEWNNYDTAKMTLGGATSGTNAGSHNATFTPTANFQWSDGTTAAKTASWSIGKASISAVPSQSGNLTYTGSAQSPSWSNFNSAQLTAGGSTNGTNAGSYTATFTPTSNYKWSDGSAAAKSVTWSIGKAAGSLSLNKTAMTLNKATTASTIVVTRAGDGAVTASSSNTSVATVSVSGTTVTVTGKAFGTATITVNVAAGTNHTAPASKTCAVTVNLFVDTLNSNTWAAIRAASDAGEGANYWAVGDTKNIKINGAVGNYTFSNLSVDVFILGFNHNSSREGGNRIHFQIGKISGAAVALCDNSYNSNVSSTGYFSMNSSNVNNGGWKSSQMRTLLGNGGTPSSPVTNTLLAAMPSDLRAVMKSTTKYTDNTANGAGDVSGNVTATTDYIFLLAEFEAFGARYNANTYEQNYQTQYDYYKAGNSRVAYRHTATTTTVWWWLRSPRAANYFDFCRVHGDGAYGNNTAYYSAGLRPGFSV